MRHMRLVVLLGVVAVLGACEDPTGEDAILAPTPALAYTRFVNAIPDTGGTDWRFIDQLEYSPVEFGMAFRSFSPYAGTAPGSRHLRIFPTSTNITITQQHFIDTNITFEAGKYYTIIHRGFTRTGSTPADLVQVIEDAIPTAVPATNLALRFIHAGTGLTGQDVYALATASTAISGTPMFDNITLGNASTYDVTRGIGTVAFRSANDNTTTAVASTLAPVGAAKDVVNNLTAIGGYSIGSSVLTAIFFPASVAGSTAASFANPGIVWLVDRHPQN